MTKLQSVLLIFTLFTASAQATTLSTAFNSNNGFSGNMFDVTNVSDSNIELTGLFAGNFKNGTSGVVEMWYRAGGYQGYTHNEAAWTLLGSSQFSSTGQDIETFFDVENRLLIEAGQTFGLYMFTEEYAAVRYTNGHSTLSDGVLSLSMGIGMSNQRFGGATYSYRSWNGTIEYDTPSEVPLPASIWFLGTAMTLLFKARQIQSKRKQA